MGGGVLGGRDIVDLCYACNQHYKIVMHVRILQIYVMHVTNIIKLSCMFKYSSYMLCMQPTLSNCLARSNIVDICYACNYHYQIVMHVQILEIHFMHVTNIIKQSCMFKYCRYMSSIQLTLSNCPQCSNIVNTCQACGLHYQAETFAL